MAVGKEESQAAIDSTIVRPREKNCNPARQRHARWRYQCISRCDPASLVTGASPLQGGGPLLQGGPKPSPCMPMALTMKRIPQPSQVWNPLRQLPAVCTTVLPQRRNLHCVATPSTLAVAGRNHLGVGIGCRQAASLIPPLGLICRVVQPSYFSCTFEVGDISIPNRCPSPVLNSVSIIADTYISPRCPSQCKGG